MDIQNYNHTNFKSLNNPVKPFKVKTGNDVIYFKEINYNKPVKKKVLKEISTFFLDNFANQSSHPYWKFCRKHTNTFDKAIYDDYINSTIKDTKRRLKNPDTTIMLGRNKKNKLTAAIITEPLNIPNVIKDENTLYLDSVAVNKKYRGNHIGETLINKVIDSNNKYSDMFLVSYSESVPFYKKLGFKPLTYRHSGQARIIDSMREERIDYPQYADFLTRPLDKKQPRWFNNI